MSRTVKELMEWSHGLPRDAFVSITLEEALQFVPYWPDRTDDKPKGKWPARLNGRVCIISDLPPNHYVASGGKVLPL